MQMQRTSFVVHMVDTEHINVSDVITAINQEFPCTYSDVREFTPEEYAEISEPDEVS
jgi:hypothetical protein